MKMTTEEPLNTRWNMSNVVIRNRTTLLLLLLVCICPILCCHGFVPKSVTITTTATTTTTTTTIPTSFATLLVKQSQNQKHPFQRPTTATTPSSSSSSSSSRLYVDGQGMAGGSRHLLGDIIRSLQPQYLKQVANAVQSNVNGMAPVNVEEFCNILTASSTTATESSSSSSFRIDSWDELAKKLSKTTNNNNNKMMNNSPAAPSAKAMIRLFGQHKEPIVTLYRDSAAWCPYCQKTWMALEEKQVPYEIVKIDMRCYGTGKPTEFLKLQPSGNLPCAIIREETTNYPNNNNLPNSSSSVTTTTTTRVIGESNDIIDALDELSAKYNNNNKNSNIPLLRPPGQEERIRDLCDNGRESLERRLYTRWMWWLTGVRRPEEYKTLFLEHWQEMEEALEMTSSQGPYFLGKELSVVDLRFIPFVERQLASLAYYKGATYLRDATKYPNIVRWLEAMESRPSFQASKSDYYTHSRSLPPQLAAGCAAEPGCEEIQKAIDSYAVGNADSDWREPGWDWCQNTYLLEAAESLINGREKIVAFAARGAGVKGFPAASAPLADPAATPNNDAIPALDLLLRHIAMSLLSRQSKKGGGGGGWFSVVGNQDNSAPAASSSAISQAVKTLDTDSARSLAECIDYLRARIGVPRDMSYPAAQALREELSKVSKLLISQSGGGINNNNKNNKQEPKVNAKLNQLVA